MVKKIIQNWGNFPKIEATEIAPVDYYDLKNIIIAQNKVIARGNGRCYGDSALQATIISTLNMNKILEFDCSKGILKAEAGTLLSEILEVIVPKGFFLPVTPGTKWITIGGAIASNVHGKNHHKEGAISNFTVSIELVNEHGELLICSESQNKQLFYDTIGGMGLTGIIATVTIKLKPIESAYIKQKTLKAKNLDQVLDYFEKYNDFTYSVAWIDCLKKGNQMGRSILILGEHSKKDESDKNTFMLHSKKQLNIPFYFPNNTLNKWTIKLFNSLYYNKQFKKTTEKIVHYDKFFYPLDSLKNWNKIYGNNGFTQYQFVIPFENGREGLKKILKKISNSGNGSFLAVLKTFGEKDKNTSELNFPTKGYTLALDFKLSKATLLLLDELDKIVLAYNGKLYLTKDVRMSKDMFEKTYGEKHITSKFYSLQTERLFNKVDI